MICIVSPHLDDAALSCGDHARDWVAAQRQVLVLNVFTGGGPGACSRLMAENLRAAGVTSTEQYVALRRAEDARCLHALGLPASDLGFIDAGLRGQAGRPDYDSLAALRAGHLGDRELALVDALSPRLQQSGAAADLVLCPMGLGGHVDHLITRAACERWVEPGRLAYYADMPYARAPWNWTRRDWAQLARSRPSIKAMSAAKRAALAHYQSQWPLLFARSSYCPELLLMPRR